MRRSHRRSGLMRAGIIALLSAAAAPGPAALAQGGPPAPGSEARPVEPGRFLSFVLSSATLQERAASLAASRDTRPEVKAFAAEMARFRGPQIERLRAFARERGIDVLEGTAEFEHRVVLRNLEPLDYLALSRRYAEVQAQALEQEVRGYEAAAAGRDAALKALAEEMLPHLRPRLEEARNVIDAVRR